MKTALKVDILKTAFLLFYFMFVLTAISAWATGNKHKKNNCGESPFETKILKLEKTASCYEVELEITYDNKVQFELSHVTFDFGCGSYANVSNSEGWKIEPNVTDPTTGLTGLKIDDILNFGKDPTLTSFQVSFNFCPEKGCTSSASIQIPKVAYKAGQCKYYAQINHNNQCGNNDGDSYNNGDGDDSTSGGEGESNNEGGGSDGEEDTNNNADAGDPDEPGDTENEDTDCTCGDNSDNPDNGTEDGSLNASVETIDPACYEENSGSINLNISGGVAPYSISWSTGATKEQLADLAAGTYAYTVTDASDQTITGDVSLQEATKIIITSTEVKPICSGQNNGTINLTVTGGEAPYTFLWDNGSTDQNLVNLFANTYAVTVTDGNGCAETLTTPLFNETTLLAKADIVDPSCQEGTPGSITINPSGGTAPYTFAWSSGETTQSIDGLTGGNYEVKVADQNGCSFSGSYPIETDQGISATAVIIETNCFNDPIGAVDLTVDGGTGPYEVVWSNTATTEDITNLISGNYTATITDALGCKIEYKASVLKDDIVIGYEGITIPSCYGSDNGGIAITISNAQEPYTIEWSNGSKEEDLSNLSADKYSVYVKDNAGCEATKSFNLPEPNPVVINYSVDADPCTGTQDISIAANGGSLEYSYLWSDGSTNSTLAYASPGTYTITVTDTRACSTSENITIEPIPTQDFSCLIVEPATDVDCGSTNNVLSSNSAGALSHTWAVSSSDQSWSISSGTDKDNVEYTAGNQGSKATFILTVSYEGGCVLTCEQTIEACIGDEPSPDNPNDEPCTCPPDEEDAYNDGNETSADDDYIEEDQEETDNASDVADNSGDENDDMDIEDEESNTEDGKNDEKEVDCDACFYTSPVAITRTDEGYLYSMDVSYKDCRYDLSHMTIDIPECFNIVNYSNSMNWKMGKVYTDPTTGLTGIKIDDIPAFGKDENMPSFTVNFILDAIDDECKEMLNCFAPDIAYKSATCVYQETTESECYPEEENKDLEVSTYPNPTCDFVNVDLKNCDPSASYRAEIYDFNGEKTCSYSFKKGRKNEIVVDLRSKKQGLYFLTLRNSNGWHKTHKIIKR